MEDGAWGMWCLLLAARWGVGMGDWLCCINTGHGGAVSLESGASNGARLGCMGAGHENVIGMDDGVSMDD